MSDSPHSPDMVMVLAILADDVEKVRIMSYPGQLNFNKEKISFFLVLATLYRKEHINKILTCHGLGLDRNTIGYDELTSPPVESEEPVERVVSPGRFLGLTIVDAIIINDLATYNATLQAFIKLKLFADKSVYYKTFHFLAQLCDRPAMVKAFDTINIFK